VLAAQWNRHWQRFHFVGGHKRYTKRFASACCVRSQRNCGCKEQNDFSADEQPVARLEYTAYSERYHAETNYEMEMYRVRFRTLHVGAPCRC